MPFSRDLQLAIAQSSGTRPVQTGSHSGQKSLTCLPEGFFAEGTIKTMTQRAIIASPMNSKTSASTVNLPKQTVRFVGKRLTTS